MHHQVITDDPSGHQNPGQHGFLCCRLPGRPSTPRGAHPNGLPDLERPVSQSDPLATHGLLDLPRSAAATAWPVPVVEAYQDSGHSVDLILIPLLQSNHLLS